jgi:DNA-binding Lrp family transcriptional regulator
VTRAETVTIDDTDRLLLNNLQGGFPVVHRPFAQVAAELGLEEDDVLRRLRRLVDTGAVPAARFEEVAGFVNGLESVSHNYERTHHYNMWFVISSEDDADIRRTIETIERETGLPVINLPSLEEYFVDIKFTF